MDGRIKKVPENEEGGKLFPIWHVQIWKDQKMVIMVIW
jgi:hypothetical protein